MLSFATAQAQTVTSPNGKVAVILELVEGGQPCYRVLYEGQDVVERSALGLKTNIGDFTQGLVLKEITQKAVSDTYQLRNIKQSCVDYEATEAVATYALRDKPEMPVMDIIFRVSDRDVAFRYKILLQKETRVCVVTEEASGFALPEGTTSFLCPQSKPMGGFARTSPSYETPYTCDEPVGKNGWGEGYTFPCLFKMAQDQWVLISETGTDGGYVGCRLLNEQGGTYRIGFPQPGELNGVGSTTPSVALPCETPWRTITLGTTLAPIVESTVANDAMGYQSVLIDAFWDQQIGYEKIAELARYGKEKGVGIFLWYNSNGAWNDAFQTPIGKMNNSRIRREEMRWMQENGIRGIKVDFFGGDKQPMMQLYEDILSDANDFGLLCIFHGCTLPRGWERMYPNYAASEAVLASENLHFGQGACDAEAYNACIHPFVRNTVGSMDFGGSALNKRYSADNQHGTTRRTSDVFALAVAVLFQSAVQHFALAPNNLEDAPVWAIDFMKRVPTTWDEVRFIDGYPGKYIILARRCGQQWFVVGINAQKEPLKKTIALPMFAAGSSLQFYSDDVQLNGSVKTIKQNKRQQLTVTIPCNGGVVLTNE